MKAQPSAPAEGPGQVSKIPPQPFCFLQFNAYSGHPTCVFRISEISS